jgi:hypothetical protein
MLRNGNFIKEDPPKIGAHYLPSNKATNLNKEEQFMQNVLLGIREHRQSFLSKVLGFMIRI